MSRRAEWPIVNSATVLGIPTVPEDNMPSVVGYRFEIIAGAVKVTQIFTETEETYSDHTTVTIPVRIWTQAIQWLDTALPF